MEWNYWIWAALALLLLIAEAMISGFVLICFAAGAAAAAIASFLGFNLIWQILIFLAVSVVVLLLMRPMAMRLTRTAGANTVGIDRVMGKRAVVLVAIDPFAGVGRVRIDREEWQASSIDGSAIPAGAVVEVLGVEGTRVKVRQLPNDLTA